MLALGILGSSRLAWVDVVSIGTAWFWAFLAFLRSDSSLDLLLNSALAGSKMVSGIGNHSPLAFLSWSSGHFLFFYAHSRVQLRVFLSGDLRYFLESVVPSQCVLGNVWCN